MMTSEAWIPEPGATAMAVAMAAAAMLATHGVAVVATLLVPAATSETPGVVLFRPLQLLLVVGTPAVPPLAAVPGRELASLLLLGHGTVVLC
jgi:hypothetical protein